MNSNTRNLLALLRVALGGGARESSFLISNDSWPTIYRMAQEQGVLALVWDAMQCLWEQGVLVPEQLPGKKLKLQWAFNVEQIERRYRKQEQAIEKLALFYEPYEIRMMLLKGYGLRRYYPIPEHRPCGDIDIWLYGEQQRADELLSLRRGVKIDEEKHHHTVFFIDGVMVENHYDFLNVHAHLSNRSIECELQRLAKEQEGGRLQVGKAKLLTPSADFNALFLLRHAAAHFAAIEIGLRHVVDWALFVNHNYDRINWSWLYRIAEEENMHRFLYSLNAISIDYLGVDPEKIPPFPRDQVLESRVLNDILHPEFSEKAPTGNFLKGLLFKYRRWWANRWKHHLVYREGLLKTFLVQIYSHLLKPKSLK